MMSIIEKLMDSAVADTDVLRRLDESGDRFEVFREVDFIISAKDQNKAETIVDFINDYHYGKAKLSDEANEVIVVIKMPVTQAVILCVSGFLNCVAELFDAELEGWGCIAQSEEFQPKGS